MFLDASAVVAILDREEGYESLVRRLEAHHGTLLVSPLAKFEIVAALARKKSGSEKKPSPSQFAAARAVVDEFLEQVEAKDVTVTQTIGEKALDAATQYGKSVGHKADLNFGDCFAYACAKAYRVELLYKGNDFSETDLA